MSNEQFNPTNKPQSEQQLDTPPHSEDGSASCVDLDVIHVPIVQTHDTIVVSDDDSDVEDLLKHLLP